ncbi:hypothetical protein SARC_02763 [Sphaeroforma arctica JP610]|uniref:Uncharacterized protein n=1 Tax=Sphaeroforma arctica JP610 TaxID=667725 RepID=A0A0L0G9V6_9EUKA|nr:hypothetical protein SARC_02763 [Sphaeroforma arctica JP610]KNC85038.1 hypothetical protein SARC_02763 [Sphaeroforma arctica JP610]|eukprot:XP_014158940.1 hypothetical protein SARC_02763 [Sphaeroforma arctica JP610]
MKEVEAISLVEAIQLNRDMLKEIFTNPEFHDCEVAIWRSVATKTVNHHLRRALQDVIDVEEVRECINVSNIIKGSAANVNEIFPMNCGSENVLLLRGHATIRVVPDAEEDSDEEDDPRRNIIESGGVEAVGAGLHKVVAPNMIFEHTMIAFISADAILMPLEATEKNTVKHRLLRMATHDMRARPTITAEKRASVAGRKSLARSRTQMGYAARASEPFFPGGGGQSSAELRPRHSVATGSRPSMHARASMNSTRESASKTPGGGPSLVRMRSQSSGAHGKGKKRNQLGPRTSLSTPNGPNVVRRQVTFTPETAEDKTNAKSPDE